MSPAPIVMKSQRVCFDFELKDFNLTQLYPYSVIFRDRLKLKTYFSLQYIYHKLLQKSFIKHHTRKILTVENTDAYQG